MRRAPCPTATSPAAPLSFNLETQINLQSGARVIHPVRAPPSYRFCKSALKPRAVSGILLKLPFGKDVLRQKKSSGQPLSLVLRTDVNSNP